MALPKLGLKLSSLAFAVSCLWAPAQAENLLEVYRAALQNDPQYLASEARMLATGTGVDQARSALLPQIGFIGGVNRTRTERDFNGPETKTDTTSLDLQLSLNQQLYHHDTWLSLSQAEKRSEQAEIAHRAQLQTLVLRVAEAYFNVLAARDGVEFAEAERKAVGQQLEQTQQRFNVGLIAITDVHEARARHDAAQAQLIAAQNTLDNNNEALRQITANYYNVLSPLRADLPLNSPEPAQVSDWVSVAEKNNLNVLAQHLATDIARQEVKRQQAGHLPTLDGYARLNQGETSYDKPNIAGTDRDQSAVVGIQLTVPLFSGMRTSAATKAAEHGFVEASQNREAAYRQAVRDTRSAFLGVNAGIASVQAFTQAVTSAQSALEATQAGFEVGTRTIVDVLQATSNLYSAKKNLSSARYNYVQNLLRLKAASGTLQDDDLLKVNSWLQ